MTKITKLLKTNMLIAVMLLVSVSYAQQGIGTNNPNPNAALDIATTNKGLLIPRVALKKTTDASPLSAHVAGMTVYNTATTTSGTNDVTPGYYVNDGVKWVKAADASVLASVEKRLTTTETGLEKAVIVSKGIRTDLETTISELRAAEGVSEKIKTALDTAVKNLEAADDANKFWQEKSGSVGVVELSKAGLKSVFIEGTATMAKATINGNASMVDASITGNAAIDGTATIKGSTTITGTTDITGLTTMTGGATIESGATITGTTTINGATSIKGGATVDKVEIKGITNIGGITTIGTASKNAKLNVNGTLTVSELKGVPEDGDVIVMATPDGALKKGSVASISTTTAIQTVASDYKAKASDGTILVNASKAAVTVTLPDAAASNKGKRYIIKKIDNGGLIDINKVTITTSGSTTIDGAETRSTSVPYQTFVIQSDGAGWWIIN